MPGLTGAKAQTVAAKTKNFLIAIIIPPVKNEEPATNIL